MKLHTIIQLNLLYLNKYNESYTENVLSHSNVFGHIFSYNTVIWEYFASQTFKIR